MSVSATSAAQSALAGEHASIYAYGVLGGVIGATGAAAGRAREGYVAHVARRDRLEERLRILGEVPVAAEPGYALPQPVRAAADAARLAREVEDRCAVLHAELVASVTGELRAEAVAWLADAATRGLSWGAQPTAFPGIDPPAT